MHPAAPHPTPIATGTGKRTAAVDEELFSRYLSKHLSVPDLSLPKNARRRPTVPSVDLSSLISSPQRISDAVLRVIRDAIGDVGAFQIVNHGLSPDLIASAAEEEYFRPPVSGDNRRRYYRYKLPRKGTTSGAPMEASTDQNMDSLCRDLEKIAQSLSLVFDKISRTGRRPAMSTTKRRSTRDPVLCLRIYKNKSDDHDEDQEKEEEEEERIMEEEQDPDHAFTLHLILGDSELHFRRRNSIMAGLSTKPGSLLVTTSKQLREWSRLDEDQLIRNSMEELVITSSCYTDRGPSVSIQLFWPLSSPSQLEPAALSVGTTISIFDQILVVLLIALAYDLFKYLKKP